MVIKFIFNEFFVPSEEQIDFVIDALENIPSEKFENDVVRIAVALYGSKDKIEEIVGFGERDIEDIKCRLYGHDGKNNCDMSIFKIWFSNSSYESLKGKTFLYHFESRNFALKIKIERKALCGQSGLYQAMKWAAGYDIFEDFSTANYQV